MITDDFLRMGWGSKTESPAWLVTAPGAPGVSLSAMIAARAAGAEDLISARMETWCWSLL